MSIKRLDHVNFITHDMEKTAKFYCEVIGLEHHEVTPPSSKNLNNLKTVYFYIPGQETAVLHVGQAQREKIRPDFTCLASLDLNHTGAFSTGSFDHLALLLEDEDYETYIQKLESHDLTYQTYVNQKTGLKQIWLLDPNGVRVELSFMSI